MGPIYSILHQMKLMPFRVTSSDKVHIKGEYLPYLLDLVCAHQRGEVPGNKRLPSVNLPVIYPVIYISPDIDNQFATAVLIQVLRNSHCE